MKLLKVSKSAYLLFRTQVKVQMASHFIHSILTLLFPQVNKTGLIGQVIHNVMKSTQRMQTLPKPLHSRRVVTEHISYKMLYLIKPLQCRPLVSDSISLKICICRC